MVNPYHFLYYKFYMLSAKINGEDNFPNDYACMMLGLALLLNFGSLFVIIDIIAQQKFMLPEFPRIGVAAAGVAYFMAHYGYFTAGGRYKRIVREFQSRRGEEESNSFAVSYAIVSVSLFIFLLLLGTLAK